MLSALAAAAGTLPGRYHLFAFQVAVGFEAQGVLVWVCREATAGQVLGAVSQKSGQWHVLVEVFRLQNRFHTRVLRKAGCIFIIF